MALGLVGKKCGMTRVFTEQGESIPVTVIELSPNRITQVKSTDSDGYHALQVTVGDKKQNRVNKSMTGHFSKAGVTAGELLYEFRVSAEEAEKNKVGDSLLVDLFKEGQKIDIKGTSKGKGFAGVIKRHNFQMQDATHGNSLSHRAHGSTGQCQSPGRVFKGKKMAGQMGSVTRTAQNQQIIKIDSERNLILVKGAVPGAPGGFVILKPTTKQRGDK